MKQHVFNIPTWATGHCPALRKAGKLQTAFCLNDKNACCPIKCIIWRWKKNRTRSFPNLFLKIMITTLLVSPRMKIMWMGSNLSWWGKKKSIIACMQLHSLIHACTLFRIRSYWLWHVLLFLTDFGTQSTPKSFLV